MNELAGDVVLYIIGALALVLFTFLLTQWKRLGNLIAQKHQEAQAKGAEGFQNALWSIAQEAYSYAEKNAVTMIGSKADIAYKYAADKLNSWGMKVSEDEIKAKIEEAYIKLDKIPAQQSAKLQIKEEVKKAHEEMLQK